jgi:hypothetical protein
MASQVISISSKSRISVSIIRYLLGIKSLKILPYKFLVVQIFVTEVTLFLRFPFIIKEKAVSSNKILT